MPKKQKKIIGILGGVGPEATAELFRRIIRATPATTDQEHLPVLVYNNPAIPDRTAAILGTGISPVPELVRTARALANAGADFLAIPCNTAHFFLPQIRRAVNMPVFDMIAITAKYLIARYPSANQVGLLATTGTVRARLYHQALQRYKIKVLTPPAALQNKLVMSAIYGPAGIKAGARTRPRELLRQAATHLRERGAQVLIAGCTEISVVLGKQCAKLSVIDPMSVLAETVVQQASS